MNPTWLLCPHFFFLQFLARMSKRAQHLFNQLDSIINIIKHACTVLKKSALLPTDHLLLVVLLSQHNQVRIDPTMPSLSSSQPHKNIHRRLCTTLKLVTHCNYFYTLIKNTHTINITVLDLIISNDMIIFKLFTSKHQPHFLHVSTSFSNKTQ